MKDQENRKVTLVYAQGPLSKEFLSKISGLKEDTTVTVKWVTGHHKCNTLKSHRKNITINKLSEEMEKYFKAQVPTQYMLAAMYPCIMKNTLNLVPDEIYMFNKNTRKFKVAGYVALPITWNDIGDTYPPTGNVPYLDDINELLEGIMNVYNEEPDIVRALFNVLYYSPIIFATCERVYVCGPWTHVQTMNGRSAVYL